MRERYRTVLWDFAVARYGYVTTHEAAELGVPPVELRKLSARGFLEHVARGLYRTADLPTTELDHYMEAVLWAGTDAVLSHDAVLAVHDLAFANPRSIRVTTPHRVRKTDPRSDVIIVQDEVPDDQRTHYHGIPSTTVARALLDSQTLIMRSRLIEAAAQARQQGLVLADEYQQLTAALQDAG